MEEKQVGRVTHYFNRVSVAAIELTSPVAIGDTIVIRGATTELEQPIGSMQFEKQDIEKAEAGQAVGIKVKEKTRRGDVVYKKQ